MLSKYDRRVDRTFTATPMINTRRTSGKPPVISIVARQWLERLEAEVNKDRNEFVEKCLTRQAAIDAVDRIFKHGKTETGRSGVGKLMLVN